jgi:hypothetical protein
MVTIGILDTCQDVRLKFSNNVALLVWRDTFNGLIIFVISQVVDGWHDAINRPFARLDSHRPEGNMILL